MAIPRRSLPVSDFFRHGSLVFGSTILANGFNYVFHFSISRILGVDGYGALSSMIALLTIVSVPAAVAATLIAKYSAEYWSSDSFGQMRMLCARLMRTLLILVAAGTAIALLSTGALLTYLHIANRTALAIFSLVIGVNLALPLLRGALQGIQDFRSFAISFAVESACKAGLGIAFAAAGFGLAGAIAGYAIGMGVSLIVTVWLLRERIGPGPKAPLDLRASQVGSRTLWVALSTAALTSMGFIDILLVKHFFTPDDAGVYGIVALIGKVLFFVVSFVPAVVLPKATELAVRSLPTRRLFLEASLTIAAISVVGLAVLWFAPTFAVRVVAGAAFDRAAAYLFPYGLAMVFLAAASAAATYKIGLNRFEFVPGIVLVAIGEVVAIALFHDSIARILEILVVGHGLALAGTLVGTTKMLDARPAIAIREEVA